MKCVFITGTPNAGKSTLAKKVGDMVGARHFDLDKLRRHMAADATLKGWVNFFRDQDEKEYWDSTTEEQHFQNIINQSEAFWLTFLEKIKAEMIGETSAIFEAVNILPHLARRDLPFEGIVLVNDSEEETFTRLKNRPRWGRTEELQRIEASRFAAEADLYKAEADKYGYPWFTSSDEAERHLLRMFA